MWRLNESLPCWHPRWYYIKRSNIWIRPLMNTFTRGRIQQKQLRKWLHGKLERCGNTSPVLTMWQASLSVRNITQTTISGILAMDMAHVKRIAINYRMLGNPFATNVVKTAHMYRWWYEEIARINPAQRNSDTPHAYISVVNESSQPLLSLPTLCIRLSRRLVVPMQQLYTTGWLQSTLHTVFKYTHLWRSGKW